jgi:hypothetical protein
MVRGAKHSNESKADISIKERCSNPAPRTNLFLKKELNTSFLVRVLGTAHREGSLMNSIYRKDFVLKRSQYAFAKF